MLGEDLDRNEVGRARMVDKPCDVSKLVCINAERVPVSVFKVKEVGVVLPLFGLRIGDQLPYILTDEPS